MRLRSLSLSERSSSKSKLTGDAREMEIYLSERGEAERGGLPSAKRAVRAGHLRLRCSRFVTNPFESERALKDDRRLIVAQVTGEERERVPLPSVSLTRTVVLHFQVTLSYPSLQRFPLAPRRFRTASFFTLGFPTGPRNRPSGRSEHGMQPETEQEEGPKIRAEFKCNDCESSYGESTIRRGARCGSSREGEIQRKRATLTRGCIDSQGGAPRETCSHSPRRKVPLVRPCPLS